MLADLDLLLIAVFCTADDLLPEPAKNARRILTDAEVVTLAVAQAIMGITLRRSFRQDRAQAARAPVPAAAQPDRVPEAAASGSATRSRR